MRASRYLIILLPPVAAVVVVIIVPTTGCCTLQLDGNYESAIELAEISLLHSIF